MENVNRNPCDFTPEIDFSLYYAGDMAGYLKFDIPFDNYPAYDYGSMREYIDTKVFGFISGVHSKYRRMGYFTAPFFVRCALRGHDGKNIFVSSPRLMTAGMLPPCLDHFSFPEYDRLGLHFRIKGSPYFKLMIRFGEMPESWRSKIRSVDVYVTRQISVYRYGGGHRCEYGDVLRSINSINSTHGRIDARFAGTPVWYVRPNNDLADMLDSRTDFYNIASIDASGIIGIRSYQLVSIHSTLDSLLDYLDTLDESLGVGEEARPRAVILPGLRSMGHREEARPCAVMQPLLIDKHQFLPGFTSGLSPPDVLL